MSSAGVTGGLIVSSVVVIAGPNAALIAVRIAGQSAALNAVQTAELTGAQSAVQNAGLIVEPSVVEIAARNVGRSVVPNAGPSVAGIGAHGGRSAAIAGGIIAAQTGVSSALDGIMHPIVLTATAACGSGSS